MRIYDNAKGVPLTPSLMLPKYSKKRTLISTIFSYILSIYNRIITIFSQKAKRCPKRFTWGFRWPPRFRFLQKRIIEGVANETPFPFFTKMYERGGPRPNLIRRGSPLDFCGAPFKQRCNQ